MAKKRGNRGIFFAVVAMMAAAGGYFVYSHESFERQSPQIEAPDAIYWNLKDPLRIRIYDNSGIKSYKVSLEDGNRSKMLEVLQLDPPKKELTIDIAPPGLEFSKKDVELVVEATDKSLWNYFMGNTAKKRISVHVDTKKPDLFIVNNSYSITRGGSALVVFYCDDPNLKECSIHTKQKRFAAAPFYKKGYYVALIAWPIQERTFRAKVVATDKAGNKTLTQIPLYLRNRRYKTTKIELKDSFLEGKIAELAEDDLEAKSLDKLGRFKYINEQLRKKNEDLITSFTSKVPQDRIQGFDIVPFRPLKNAAKVASFGDYRYYYYQGRLISEAYHMGLDLASTKMAPIFASNPADVTFAGYNGIYGNMPILSHGLGLYTLYGHCSSLFVRPKERVQKEAVIAKTGRTGLALGDHLHFEVVVQGVPVRPEEWMDRNWIRLNITNVMNDAKKLIDKR